MKKLFSFFQKKPLRKINVGTIQEMIENENFKTHTYAKIISASLCIETGAKLVTFELFFPRCILAEQNTHRIFSRNTGSSRAIPVLRMLSELLRTPFKPLFWGANKSGMQSAQELPIWKQLLCSLIWSTHRFLTYVSVRLLTKLGLHKQWANRLLEPHTYVRQVVTSSDFEPYFHLRLHDDAQPEIIHLAALMQHELDNVVYRRVSSGNTHNEAHNWHLPYITYAERQQYQAHPLYLAKLSASRCARTSYLTQDGISPNPEKEINTFKMLVESKPMHSSPLEHQAYPMQKNSSMVSRNLKGFKQYREYYEEKEFGKPIVIPKV